MLACDVLDTPTVSAASAEESAPARPEASAEPTAARRADFRLYWSVAGLVILLGAALRVRQWMFGRGMWGDELFIAHNIHDRNFELLLRPLTYSQSAPIGWLWLERIALLAFGAGEQALRLVPLLYGLALLPLVAYFGWRLMSKPAAWATITLVAVAPQLIAYSNQVKQYSSEAFWVTLIVCIAVLLAQRDRLSWRAGIVFWVAAGVGVTMSALAIPVAGALAVLLVLQRLAERGRTRQERLRNLGRFMAAIPVWLVLLVTMGLPMYRASQADPLLRAFWERAHVYPERPLTDLPATWAWFTDKVTGLGTDPLEMWSLTLFLLILLLGAVLCWRRIGGLSVAMLLLPIAVGLGGGAVSAYPLTGRLAVYAVPTLIILAGFAASSPSAASASSAASPPLATRSVLGWVRCAVALVGIAVLMGPQLRTDVDGLRHPASAYMMGSGGNLSEYREALRYVADHKQPGEAFLVTRESSNAQSYYGPTADGIIYPAEAGACPGVNAATQLAGRTRLWLYETTDYTDEENKVLNERLGKGATISEHLFRGARVLLIELPTGSTAGTDVCIL